MWYRDPALAEIRIEQLTREARNWSRAAQVMGGRRRPVGQVRVIAAGGVRTVGRAVMAIAAWIDVCTAEADAAKQLGDVAYPGS